MLNKINSRSRGLVEVFSILISIGSLSLTLNYFLAIFVALMTVNYAFFRRNRKPSK